MILDCLDNIEAYRGIDPNIYEGLELLRTAVTSLPEGRYSTENEALYYMIQAYDTKLENNTPEVHIKYADIQFIISGQEMIGIGDISEMTSLEEHPDRDLYLYQGSMDYITLSAGKFAVFWPQEPHAPAIAVNGQPETCRKCVVKVRIS